MSIVLNTKKYVLYISNFWKHLKSIIFTIFVLHDLWNDKDLLYAFICSTEYLISLENFKYKTN